MITAVNKNQPVTIVAFSGLAPKNAMFEWVKTMDRLPCNFVGVRDPANDWYQTHKDEIAGLLRETLREIPCLFVGASAGGFAALMFGRMIVADAVLAFCPQSACGAAKRSLGDLRWDGTHCNAAVPSCDIGGYHPNAVVHYAANDEFDVMHAARLNCRQVRHAKGGHNLPEELKRAGVLDGIIMAAVKEAA